MENLNIILFGSGFAIAIVALIIMLIKAMKRNKIGFVAPFLVVIGLASLCSGLWLTITPIRSSNNTVATNTNANGTTTNKANASTGTNNTKVVAFDGNGSVVPQKSPLDMWGNETIIDADGSKSVGGRLYTPEGIYYSSNYVGVPDGKTYQDGKHYKLYSYMINNVDGTISVEEQNVARKDDNATTNSVDLGGGKFEYYPPNSGYEMKYIDFIYKYIPVSNPKNTVKNDFISGTYVGKEEKILETKTTMSINIIDNKLLDFKCSYIAGMDNLYGYNIEELGKNAYKLYLYHVTVKADTNGGGTTISNEPIKRTFIIYMKSKDSFDIVFTSDDVKRTSINMNKQ